MKIKLKSQRGASLLISLLLFLVCAVIGSIVLTAGTAAAGRLADLGKADRRYYTASSAAQLFGETFGESEPVVFQRVKEWDRTKTTTIANGVISITQPDSPEDKYNDEEGVDPDASGYVSPYRAITIEKTKNDGTKEFVEFKIVDGDTSKADLLSLFSYILVTGKNELPLEKHFREIWKSQRELAAAQPPVVQPPMPMALKLDYSYRDPQKNTDINQSVDIRAVFSWDGTVVLYIKSEAGGKPYTLVMTLIGDINEVYETSEAEKGQPVVDSTGGVYTETLTTTFKETKTTTVAWKVLNIQVLRGGAF